MEHRTSFSKGLFISLLVYASSLLAALLPVVGWLISLTLVPYLSSALGARHAHPKERVPLALTASFIWSSVETLLQVLVFRYISSAMPMGFKMDTIGTLIIVAIWALNTIFGVLGALHPWKDPFSNPPA